MTTDWSREGTDRPSRPTARRDRRLVKRFMRAAVAAALVTVVLPMTSPRANATLPIDTDRAEFGSTSTIEPSTTPTVITTGVKLAHGGVYPPFQVAGPSGTGVKIGQPDQHLRPRIDGCGIDYSCFRYELELLQEPESGDRLRFGIDYQEAHLNDPDFVDYDVVILDSKGNEVSRAAWDWLPQSLTFPLPHSPLFLNEDSFGNLEAFVDNPTDSSYTAVVIAMYVPTPGSGFQPRAKLENPYKPTPARRLLLPNIQAYSPHDLGFGCEGEGVDGILGALAGILSDDPLMNTTVPCDVRLRFSYGYGNAGEGPLRLEFTPATDGADKGDVIQRVFREPDERNAYDAKDPGQSEIFAAGTYHLHASHQHYHYDPMFQVQLFSYDADTGDRQDLRRTLKVGNCGHDWFMVDFMTTFGQDPRGTQHSDGCTGASGQSVGPIRIGVSAGWGDIYSRNTGDSYVVFGEEIEGEWRPYGTGDYLLVETVNVGENENGQPFLTESDTSDNVGYTHLRVTAPGNVCVVERGLGASPHESIRQFPTGRPSC